MVNKAQVPAAAKATAARRPWNTSTRLNGSKPQGDVREGADVKTSGEVGHDDDDAAIVEEKKRSHSRCTSPTCQSRRKEAAAAVTTTGLPVSSHRGVHIRSDKTKRRSQGSDRVAHSQDNKGSPENPTRAMIERAFEAAFTSTLQDPGLTQLDSSIDVAVSGTPQKLSQRGSSRDALCDANDTAKIWRARYVKRRDLRQRAVDEQLARDTKAVEFQRSMLAARVEYQQRKLAIQSLQARIHREIQFLESTAAELAHRETLLDESFEGYEQWMRTEFDCDASGSNARAG